MERTVNMPKLGMTMTEGVIVTWSVAVGDVVAKDALLGEVETDKVTLEIESPAAGRVTQILVNAGDTVPVGAPILLIESEATVPATAAPTDLPAPSAAPVTPAVAPVAPPLITPPPAFIAPTPAPELVTVASAPSTNGHGRHHGKIPSTPLARRLAAAHGIDLAAIAQVGVPVRSAAVLAHVTGTPVVVPPPTATPVPASTNTHVDAPTASTDTSVDNVSLTSMRRIIAERTTTSFTTTPHIYLDTEVDMWRIERWRVEAKQAGQSVSATVLLLRAVALALRQHPDLNAGFVAAQGSAPAHIQRWAGVHLAIAVAVPGGLVAPVLRDADRRSLADLATEMQRLADAARNGKLSPDDLVGGTFSISNLGMYGIDTFHAIISAPQAAILAVGRITRRPVIISDAALGDTIAIRPIMKLSLSADHRAVDGATGAQFLSTLRALLEDPTTVIADPDTVVAHKGA